MFVSLSPALDTTLRDKIVCDLKMIKKYVKFPPNKTDNYHKTEILLNTVLDTNNQAS